MAFVTTIMKSASHFRSTSLPSANHPLTASLEDHLTRLRTSDEASTSISHKLRSLKDLHECVVDWLQLPVTQQSLFHSQQKGCVDELLDGSLRLLDVCGMAKDVFSQMKALMQELESSLRRKRGDSCLTIDIQTYLKSRKNLKKVIGRWIGDLDKMKQKHTLSSNQEGNGTEALDLLKVAEHISVTIFESLLSMICSRNTTTKPSGWTVVSKLLRSKKLAAYTNDLEDLDAKLLLLSSSKGINAVLTQNILKRLKALECSFQELEDDLECVFRYMVKTRASALNKLTL